MHNLINDKLTQLHRGGDKIVVGNRRGKVFVVNATWLGRRPHIWTLPVLADSVSVVRIARPPQVRLHLINDPPERAIRIDWDEIKMREWRHPRYGFRVFCGYDPTTQRWYSAPRPSHR